jgi:predicted nucleic acid-binding protein
MPPRSPAPEWIEVKPIQNPAELLLAEAKFGIGAAELSTIILARELKTELALVDDLRARRLAKREGLEIRGVVGLSNFFTVAAISPISAPPFGSFWVTRFTLIAPC